MPKHVIVVGAGPAGATLSYLLARRSIRVTLLERQTDFEREFRGEVLMPSGIEALAQTGLAKKLEAIPNAPVQRVEIYRGSRFVAEIALAPATGMPRVVPQPQLLEMLVGDASKFAGFAIHRGATVRDLIMDRNRVAGVHADTVDGPREFQADLVVASDGRASVIRKRLALTPARILQPFDVIWAKAPIEGYGEEPAFRAYAGPGHLALTYPSPLGHLQIGWVINKGRFADIRRLGAGGWVPEMAPHVSPALAAFLEGNRSALAKPVLLDVICDRLADWTSPGAILIGDASHPMSPVGGQGINIALRDAIVAANHLVPVAARDDASVRDFDTAASRIQAERQPEVARIQAMQQFGPSVLFAPGVISAALLSAPAIALAKTIFASTLARRAEPFLHGIAKVTLEV
ncbi:MAG TPA: FAD-dependent monooxygenase [Candidatus Binataceae bacterium]|nr:FAD-dependent monooxygenase [Candidatus Binataceae bacterium]